MLFVGVEVPEPASMGRSAAPNTGSPPWCDPAPVAILGSGDHPTERSGSMHTIIVPIDGSGSERALPVAEKLAAHFDAGLVLVHVQERMVAGRGGRIPARLDEAERLAHVRELVTGLRADGFEAELETHRAILEHPADVIAAAARRHDADAIVLATRGHAPIVGVLASSVAQRLLHAAPCPVLVVTPGTAREPFRWAGDREQAAA